MAASPIARALTRVAPLAVGLLLAGCQDLPTTQRAGWADHPMMAYDVRGQGAPAVVLQSGLGDGKAVWSEVFDALARDGRVIAYDRPGYGDSPAVDDPRDPCSIATEERTFLRSAGVEPPYVLVGHSLGGLYQYVYARLFPEDVAGLVLLDPTHPRHWQQMQHDAPALATAMRAMIAVSLSRTVRREFDDQAECLGQVDAKAALRVPVRVLVSGRHEPFETAEFIAMQDRLRTDWLRLTGAPRLEVVPRAGHDLEREAPQAVIDAVRELRAQVRAH